MQGPDGQIGPLGPIGPQGLPGFKGDIGPQGPIGLTGPTGAQGATGNTGPQGESLKIKGTVAAQANLPPTGNTVGDGWITADTGSLWTWSGSAWTNVGVIRGPQGVTGPAGPQGPIGLTGPQGPIGLLNDPIVSPVTFNANAISAAQTADRNYAQFRNGMVVVCVDITSKVNAGVIGSFNTSIPAPMPGQGIFQQAGTAIIWIEAGARELNITGATVNQRYTAVLTYMANGEGMGNAGVSPVYFSWLRPHPRSPSRAPRSPW